VKLEELQENYNQDNDHQCLVLDLALFAQVFARPSSSNQRPHSGAPTSSRPSTSSSPYRTPSSPPGGSPFSGKGGGRPPQKRWRKLVRFGKGGKGKIKTADRKVKKKDVKIFENLPAPQLGGAVVPKGDGKTVVRMRRGATLMDFAEKIKADPAALVSALFHLGEMVTATQYC
jgi:translation initiation factor IF-2